MGINYQTHTHTQIVIYAHTQIVIYAHNTLFPSVHTISAASHVLATSLFPISKRSASLAVLTGIRNCCVSFYEVVYAQALDILAGQVR